jgi:hypothetical protein
MSKRKETPDVLAEILGGAPDSPGSLEANSVPPKAARQAAPAKKAAPRPAARAEEKTFPPGKKWEYRVVSFQEHRGWRPRFENGIEIPNWVAGPWCMFI